MFNPIEASKSIKDEFISFVSNVNNLNIILPTNHNILYF